MSEKRKPRSPVMQLAVGRSFYAAQDFQVGHFAAMWHSFNVGQLLANDLNTISARYGISIADFHLLGALMIDEERPFRATDLAETLNVSATVISGRITRLDSMGLLQRAKASGDRRATLVTITPAGIAMVHAVGDALHAQARFVRHYQSLPESDRSALDRIMAELHTLMHRDYAPVAR